MRSIRTSIQARIMFIAGLALLLRGKDPALRDKYWAAFNERSQQIEARGGALVQRMPRGELRDRVRGFMDLHGAMVFAYGLATSAAIEAAREQSIGIEQVNSAVGEVDRMPQQNGALVEKASAAARR